MEKELLALLIKLKKHPKIHDKICYSERVEYMIIKVKQLDIIDRRIRRNIKIYYSIKDNYQSDIFQQALAELWLDAESFFYVASKLVDLYFEGLNDVFHFGRNPTKQLASCYKIQTIRNQLIEHSNRRQPIENELNQFGLNTTYGPYLRSVKRKGTRTRFIDKAYVPLRNGLIKELSCCLTATMFPKEGIGGIKK